LIPAVAAALGVTALEFFAMANGVDLKALRLASGKTSTEIAEQTQVSSATYLRWESGRSRATQIQPFGADWRRPWAFAGPSWKRPLRPQPETPAPSSD